MFRYIKPARQHTLDPDDPTPLSFEISNVETNPNNLVASCNALDPAQGPQAFIKKSREYRVNEEYGVGSGTAITIVRIQTIFDRPLSSSNNSAEGIICYELSTVDMAGGTAFGATDQSTGQVTRMYQIPITVTNTSGGTVVTGCQSDEATYAEASCDSLGGTWNNNIQKCERIVVSEYNSLDRDELSTIITDKKFAIIADGNFGAAGHSILCGNLAVGVKKGRQEGEFADYFDSDATFPEIDCGESTPGFSSDKDMGNMVVGNNLDVRNDFTAEKGVFAKNLQVGIHNDSSSAGNLDVKGDATITGNLGANVISGADSTDPDATINITAPTLFDKNAQFSEKIKVGNETDGKAIIDNKSIGFKETGDTNSSPTFGLITGSAKNIITTNKNMEFIRGDIPYDPNNPDASPISTDSEFKFLEELKLSEINIVMLKEMKVTSKRDCRIILPPKPT